ncbi:MAG: hypothetical protein OXE81_01915 [Gammaproteobacteria bacterium]|nr:hypothetical protein [Gammaproteobacteria bacterium]
MDTASWERLLAEQFPKLASEGFHIVEQASRRYNCIAYAAGDTTDWWWPGRYWPPWATVNHKIESLEELFAGLDYGECDDDSFEAGYEKVVLYVSFGRFEHAARQVPTGRWRSKMGRGPLIEHLSPESLAGGVYGSPTAYMRRPATVSGTSA